MVASNWATHGLCEGLLQRSLVAWQSSASVAEVCFTQAANIRETYNDTRREGLNAEVKRRILMGTYALSAGYYDAYYKRAQQVVGTTSYDLDFFVVYLRTCQPHCPMVLLCAC